MQIKIYWVITNILGIDISDGTISSNSDTHGGFHGDGYTFAVISFIDTAGATLADETSNNGHWRSLPFTDNLQIAVYGKN